MRKVDAGAIRSRTKFAGPRTKDVSRPICADVYANGHDRAGSRRLWAGRDLFGGALSYNGFGDVSLHIRDVLDVGDLRLMSSSHFEWQPGHGAT